MRTAEWSRHDATTPRLEEKAVAPVSRSPAAPWRRGVVAVQLVVRGGRP